MTGARKGFWRNVDQARHGSPIPNGSQNQKPVVTSALLAVTSALLVVTSALLVVTSALLVVTSALLVVTNLN